MGSSDLLILGVVVVGAIVLWKPIMELVTGFSLGLSYPNMSASDKAAAKQELQRVYGKSNYGYHHV